MLNLERVMENESEQLECEVCEGMGGWDIAIDPEVSDNWRECEACEGRGWNYV